MTDYTPRDLVDHDAIGAVIRDKSDKILMFYHKKFDLWTVPIGKAEADETPYEGMCSEVLQECGLVVKAAEKIGARPITYIRNGKEVHIVLHVYEVKRYEGAPANKEPAKHLDMRFMSEAEIRSQIRLSDATQLFLETV